MVMVVMAVVMVRICECCRRAILDVVVMTVTVVLRAAVEVRKNIICCMLGGGIIAVGSGGSVNSGCIGSCLAHQHNKNHQYHHSQQHHHTAYI